MRHISMGEIGILKIGTLKADPPKLRVCQIRTLEVTRYLRRPRRTGVRRSGKVRNNARVGAGVILRWNNGSCVRDADPHAECKGNCHGARTKRRSNLHVMHSAAPNSVNIAALPSSLCPEARQVGVGNDAIAFRGLPRHTFMDSGGI